MQQLKINKNIPASASYDWFKLAFITFREMPLQFIALTFGQIVTMVICSYLRIGGLVSPMFIAGFADLASQVDTQKRNGVINTFKKLLLNKNLILLMLINLFCSLLSLVLLLVDLGNSASLAQKIFISVVLIVFMVTVNMAMWISPVICAFNNIGPLAAMRLSLKVGLYNLLTWFLYAVLLSAIVVVLGIGVMALISQMIKIGYGFEFGLLILGCVILSILSLIFYSIVNIASYHIYKDAFLIEHV